MIWTNAQRRGCGASRFVARFGALFLVALWLTSCAAYRSDPLVATRIALKNNAALILHQPVEIPAGRSSVIIQQGEVISGGRDRYVPFCELVVNKLAETPRTIRPDVFTIKQVGGQIRYGDRRHKGTLQLAALDSFVLAAGGLPPDITQTWRMRLMSKQQPDVILLVCGGVERNMGEQVDPPTFAQIRAALGAVATLRSGNHS